MDTISWSRRQESNLLFLGPKPSAPPLGFALLFFRTYPIPETETHAEHNNGNQPHNKPHSKADSSYIHYYRTNEHQNERSHRQNYHEASKRSSNKVFHTFRLFVLAFHMRLQCASIA